VGLCPLARERLAAEEAGARSIARNIAALEDGQGIYVLLGRDTAAQVEGRILEYVATATGLTPAALART
jgi:hypothetical protein